MFKGTVSRDFWLLVFLMNQFPPSTAISNFFENSRIYSRLKVHHWCHWHQWQMEKIIKQKNFNNFVCAPLGSRVNININFAFKFTLRCQQPDIVPIICHRCQQHKQNWWQNLPPVSLIPVANLPPVSLILAAILPPVSLTPVVHLDLRISPRIFEKIRNDPNVISRGLGEGDSWKKPEEKNLVTLSF